MAYKKLRAAEYIADTKDDLKYIKEGSMGADCYVIKDASSYKLMSTGEWVKQNSSSSNEIDMNDFITKEELNESISEIARAIPTVEGLATEEFVNGAIKKIKVPSVAGFATQKYVDNAVNKMSLFDTIYGKENLFGLMVKKSDNISLVDAMLKKGQGLYNFHIEKGSLDLPVEVIEKNSSCRGLCCVDTYHSINNWCGWIIMFDQDCDVYVRYIRDAVPTNWKKFMTV